MGADAFYLFPEEFFARLERLGDALVVLDAGTAVGLFLSGGGAMHYFLAGSTLEARKLASANLVLFEAMKRARDAGLETLVLGGGYHEDDSLHRFKRSIGAGRAPKVIGSAIHDQSAYDELTAAAGVPPDGRILPGLRACINGAWHFNHSPAEAAADQVGHLAAAFLDDVERREVPQLERPVVRRLDGVGHRRRRARVGHGRSRGASACRPRSGRTMPGF